MQTEGKIIYAMDALFGLPRKKAAGVSYRPAVQGHLFFVEQSCVDEHVTGAKTQKLMANVCYNYYCLVYMHVHVHVCAHFLMFIEL